MLWHLPTLKLSSNTFYRVTCSAFKGLKTTRDLHWKVALPTIRYDIIESSLFVFVEFAIVLFIHVFILSISFPGSSFIYPKRPSTYQWSPMFPFNQHFQRKPLHMLTYEVKWNEMCILVALLICLFFCLSRFRISVSIHILMLCLIFEFQELKVHGRAISIFFLFLFI